jgi:hypothetical protein
MAQGTSHTQSSMKGGPTTTVSEARTSATWWTTPAGTKTPYTLLTQFRSRRDEC